MSNNFFGDLKTPSGKPADVELTNLLAVEPVKKPRPGKDKLGERAYLWWRDLPDGERTYSAVAREFGVSVSAVSRFFRRHGYEARRHNEGGARAAEITTIVATRVAAAPQLPAAATPEAEVARAVRQELLTAGQELVARVREHLKHTPLVEPAHLLRALEIGSKLMIQATESSDAATGASLAEMLKARLARLQADDTKPAAKPAVFTEVKDVEFDDA